jgi:glucosamine kinase
MTEYFIGIDGGASSCRARLRDRNGNLLGEGCGGPANIHLDLDLAKESIRAASKAALRAAGVEERLLHYTHAGLGLAGAGLKSACDQLRAGLTAFASTTVATDAYTAWLGAHRGANGGIVILGTGSCGLAIIDGKQVQVGGYGAEISDEAGGQRMGREALRRSLWRFDGRAEQTKLSTLILDRFRQDPTKVVSFAAKATPAQYAEFAPLILEYASRHDDPLAVELVEEAADAAAGIIGGLIAAGTSAISLIGGLAEPLRPWLPARLRGCLTAPQSDPLDGAILMAQQDLRSRRESEESQRSSAA